MNKTRFKNYIIKHAKTFMACTYDGTLNQSQIFATYSDAMAWLASRTESVKRLEISSEKGVFYSAQFCDIEELLQMAQEFGSAYAVRMWHKFSREIL